MSPSEHDIEVADKIIDDLVEHWGMDLGCLRTAIAQALAAAREQAVKPFIDAGLALSDGTPRKVLGTLPRLASGEFVGNHATVWAANAGEVFSMRIDNIGATDSEESDSFFEACDLYSTREAALASKEPRE